MLLLEVLTSAAGIAVLAPVLVLSSEVLIAMFSRTGGVEPMGAHPRLAVVIPAHDEAAGISETLRSIIPQLHSGDRLLVVADNCVDETAALASASGAEVVTRNDPYNLGKGYALDYGMIHLSTDPPDVALIVDADCRVAQGSIDRLGRVCARTDRPVQALNLSQAPPGARSQLRIAEFASLLKNYVRPLGLRALGLPCQLTGTGMAFPWGRISRATLASGHIVEDLMLGLELAGKGAPPLFCPEARVTSYFPDTEEGFKSQRTRWEHGYLDVLVKDAPGVIIKSLSTGNFQLLGLALDLCVPPIALLAILSTAVWIASAIAYVVWRWDVPLLIASGASGLLAFTVLASWARYGRGIVSPGSLALAIMYALWKIPLYLRFLVARQLGWVRTKRNRDPTA